MHAFYRDVCTGRIDLLYVVLHFVTDYRLFHCMLNRFNQLGSASVIAGLGDRSAFLFGPGRIFRRDQTKKRHQGFGIWKSPKIGNLRYQNHCAEDIKTFERFELFYAWRIDFRIGDFLYHVIKTADSGTEIIQMTEMFGQHLLRKIIP